MMKQIIINATATKNSGALTILKDLISFCLENERCQNFNFYLFTTINDFSSKKNLKVYEFNTMSWKQRINWDNGGLKKFCYKESIKPDLIISLQNTCTNFSQIPQLVYYHQSLPLIKYRWNLFKKDEKRLFLYSHFYKYFVNKYNKNAKYVVQLPYIKDLFVKKFRNIKSENVYVIRPNEPYIDCDLYKEENHSFRFIYPATPFSYKNHKCIIKALNILNKNEELNKLFEVIFTVPDDNVVIRNLILKYKLQNKIKCIGARPYTELMELYRNSDVLLFPSKIETYGMPLVEASKFGLYIIAADLPYANEVLEKYNNKKFINPDDYEEWAKAIKYCINDKLEKHYVIEKKENTWNEFFNIVDDMVDRK